ncbi:MAG: transposase [Anaerolineae bacterium]
MSTEHFIAMDTHCTSTDVAVVTGGGRVSMRTKCVTTIPALVEAVTSVRRPRYVTFEEGPLADWLFRNLAPHVDGVFVCEPRRNQLIAKDSDKDDPIDAGKLADLYRGGYLKRVHHPESLGRAVFKQHVATYHDVVRQRVAAANRTLARLRRHGVFVREADFASQDDREGLLRQLPASQLLREDMECLWKIYDTVLSQEEGLRKRLTHRARREEMIRRFVRLPGVSWIRGATFFVFVDTPWRFRGKSALWKYMGIGLDRKHSGQGAVRLRVTTQCNRPLKGMILGAAITAITMGDNPFADQHQHWIAGGLSPRNARRNVARSLAATLWGMWKNQTEYRPEWVGQGGRSQVTACGSSKTGQ